MASPLHLHIGLMKSGTSYLQGKLKANPEFLAGQGWNYPLPWLRQVRAAADFISRPGHVPGKWDALSAELTQHDGPSLLSMEYFTMCKSSRIKQLTREFPDLHVLITARDMGRGVPAMWQEGMKNRRTWDWDTYLRQVERGGDAGTRFFRQQDVGEIVTRWADQVTPERVTVITVPPPGSAPTLLWTRFLEALAVTDDPTMVEPPRSNESLGAASALMLREINELTAEWSAKEYERGVKRIAKHSLVKLKAQEPSIGFTVPQWLRERSRVSVEKVRTSGCRVVGDLADLEPCDVPGVAPSSLSAQDVHTATLRALLHVSADN